MTLPSTGFPSRSAGFIFQRAEALMVASPKPKPGGSSEATLQSRSLPLVVTVQVMLARPSFSIRWARSG